MLKMKNLKTVLRIIFGLFLLFFGLNGLLQFAPIPEVGPEAGAFLGAIASTKIFFPLISIIEIATGALILLNKAVPLALVLIFPILLCAVLFITADQSTSAGLRCFFGRVPKMSSFGPSTCLGRFVPGDGMPACTKHP